MSGNNSHKDHRSRMRTKFMNAPNSIADHELLEMLLYGIIPMKNTNEQAHMLLRCGKNKLENVLNLQLSEIKKIDGLGENAAVYLSLLRELYLRIEKQKAAGGDDKKITPSNVGNMLLYEFMGMKKEKFMLFTADAECNLIDKYILSVGSDTTAMVSVKEVVKTAVSDEAKYVFLAHNHPSGPLLPSNADIQLTMKICEALALVEIPVIEHYIVNDKDVFGIIKNCDSFR